MSDPILDALADTARNRGLKLVRSRVRTPGKRRFGKVGLTDADGKSVLGIDDKGPTATPDEVESFLRNLGAKDWGASLGYRARRSRDALPPMTTGRLRQPSKNLQLPSQKRSRSRSQSLGSAMPSRAMLRGLSS